MDLLFGFPLVVWLSAMLGAGLLASRFNRNAFGWVLLAFLISWIAVLVLACAGAKAPASASNKSTEVEPRDPNRDPQTRDDLTNHEFSILKKAGIYPPSEILTDREKQIVREGKSSKS